MKKVAEKIVSSGDRSKILCVLFNQIVNHCKRTGVNHSVIFQEIIDELQGRLDEPHTPAEFLEKYGD